MRAAVRDHVGNQYVQKSEYATVSHQEHTPVHVFSSSTYHERFTGLIGHRKSCYSYTVHCISGRAHPMSTAIAIVRNPQLARPVALHTPWATFQQHASANAEDNIFMFNVKFHDEARCNKRNVRQYHALHIPCYDDTKWKRVGSWVQSCSIQTPAEA